jgi:hypothetical protein
MDRGRVGEERGSKETDRCPLTASSIFTNDSSLGSLTMRMHSLT